MQPADLGGVRDAAQRLVEDGHGRPLQVDLGAASVEGIQALQLGFFSIYMIYALLHISSLNVGMNFRQYHHL